MSDSLIKPLMPAIICNNSLKSLRQYPWMLSEWISGRAAAAAQIEPTIENIAAKNECNFLATDYADRHFGGMK